MEIDAARTKERSKEDKAKLIKERKCFICEKTGHITAKCYSRNKDKGKAKAAIGKAYIAKINEEKEDTKNNEPEESPPDYNNDSVVAAVKRMSTDRRKALLKHMALKGF